MAWNTPTITRTRGQLFQHTYVDAVATLDGTNTQTLSLTGATAMPLATFGGLILMSVAGEASTRVITVNVRDKHEGNLAVNDYFVHALTLGAATGQFVAPLFEDINLGSFQDADPALVYKGVPRLITWSGDWDILAVSDNAASDGTVTFKMALISYNVSE